MGFDEFEARMDSELSDGRSVEYAENHIFNAGDGLTRAGSRRYSLGSEGFLFDSLISRPNFTIRSQFQLDALPKVDKKIYYIESTNAPGLVTEITLQEAKA